RALARGSENSLKLSLDAVERLENEKDVPDDHNRYCDGDPFLIVIAQIIGASTTGSRGQIVDGSIAGALRPCRTMQKEDGESAEYGDAHPVIYSVHARFVSSRK